jgi:N utilization substance protein A
MFMEALNVDEVVGQLLASEGFGSVEELVAVEAKEIASIEGFDDDTAAELQSRAADYLGQIEAELDDKRKALGVDDDLKEVPGITTRILVALGENGVKTVEDLAGCATDDLAGWSERKDGETTKHAGIIEDVSREDADALIMQARVKMGWIKEEDLAPPPAAEEPAEAGEVAAGA